MRAAFFLCLLVTVRGWSAELPLAWPTPNPAWSQGRGLESYVQPTASGEINSGLFGGTRSGGRQFHEGIDLKPIRRDAKGEPTDAIFAIMDGVVRHLAHAAGSGGYGRYVVLEHPGAKPAVYTLYAHLGSIDPALRLGGAVKRGQVIGIMGRSAGGYTIPKERAHLHLEIGLMMTQTFAAWYAGRGFGSPNQHGLWNGINLMGVDPLEIFNALRNGKVDSIAEYFEDMKPVLRVRIASMRIPDFTERYPSLVERREGAFVGGWDIWINSTGLPFRWRALEPADVKDWKSGEVRLFDLDERAIAAARSRSLVSRRRGVAVPGEDLETVLQQLFGVPGVRTNG